jgi:hypothetical protein
MSEEWVNSGALLARMNFGLDLAAGRIDGVRVDTGQLFSAGEGEVRGVLAAVLPSGGTGGLEAAIAAELASMADASERERRARAVGLALGSPAFQRR